MHKTCCYAHVYTRVRRRRAAFITRRTHCAQSLGVPLTTMRRNASLLLRSDCDFDRRASNCGRTTVAWELCSDCNHCIACATSIGRLCRLVASANEVKFSSAFVCLFVCQIAGLRKKNYRLNRLSQNSVERWHLGTG